MQPEITLFSIIMLVGAAHGLFLALTLLNSHAARGSGHAFLAVLTLAFAIDLAHEFLYQSHYLLDILALAYIDPVVNLVYGPAIYLYVRALTDGASFEFTGFQWMHTLPVSIAFIAILAMPDLSADQFTHLYYIDAAPNAEDEARVQRTVGSIALASVISMGIYVAISARRLLRHARRIKEQFSSIEKMTLNWLVTLLAAFSLLYLVLIFDGVFSDALGFNEDLNKLLYLMVVIVIYSMGYLGMRQPAIFTNRIAESTLDPAQADTGSSETGTGSDAAKADMKYRSSALSPEMSAALGEELRQHMETAKPYLESQLTLPQLAAQMGISPNYLSQVINEQMDKNFFDFINAYRVDEARSLLAGEQAGNTSIVTISFDAGFNSKSAFYTAFNKHVGMTPTRFRQSLRQQAGQ